MGSICGGGTPTRMRSNAVGGGTRTLCLAWEVAIMMPLQAVAGHMVRMGGGWPCLPEPVSLIV